MPGYVTVEEVRSYTGVKPEWLGITSATSEADLNALLTPWIAQAEELVEKYVGATYDPSTVPHGVKNATVRVVGNIIGQARLHRTQSVVNIDEYGRARTTLAESSGQIFTDDIKADLGMYRSAANYIAGPITDSVGILPL